MADRTDDTRSASEIGGGLMTTRYVGIGGNDANDGLSWANRKLTLNGVEDTPVQAGDTVYVGAGTYREQLTCDVNGSAGNPISYIGDYDGSHTDGVGGIVTISGSDDDTTYATRHGILTNVNYRTFEGFNIEVSPQLAGYYKNRIACVNNTNIVVKNCFFGFGFVGIQVTTTTGTTFGTFLIENCIFQGNYSAIRFTAVGQIDSEADVHINNCLFVGQRSHGVLIKYVGGVHINNCSFYYVYCSVTMDSTALKSGQHCYLTNSTMLSGGYQTLVGVSGATSDLLEDYNNFCDVSNARVNVDVGAHSTTTFQRLNPLWGNEILHGGKLVTPFDFISTSPLINQAGSSPTATDIRGTSIIGASRELGAIEYDPSLDKKNTLLSHGGMTGGMRG